MSKGLHQNEVAVEMQSVLETLLSGSAPYGLKRSVISVSDSVQFILMKSLRFWVRSNKERLRI